MNRVWLNDRVADKLFIIQDKPQNTVLQKIAGFIPSIDK